MDEKFENNIETQKEAENTAYQTALEEPIKPVETFSNQTITTIKPAKKNNNVWIPIVVIVVVALVSAAILFLKIRNNPRYTLVNSLNTWSHSFEKLTKHVQKIDMDFNEQTVKLSGKMNVKAPILLESISPEEQAQAEHLLDLINKLHFDMDVRANRKDKLLSVGLKGDLEDETLFDIVAVVQDNNQYLLLRNVLERYLDLGETEIFEEDSQEIKQLNEDSQYVWNVIQKSLRKNIKSSYIKTGNEKTLVGEEMVSTKTTTLVLNEKNMTELMSNVVKDLQKDKRAKAFITSLYPSFVDYEVEMSEDTSNPLNYTVYTKGGKIVKISLTDDEGGIIYTPGRSNTDTFELVENGEVLIAAYLTGKSDGFELVIKDKENQSNQMTLVQKVENEKTTYQLDASIEELEMNAIYTSRVEEVEKNKSYNMDIELSLDAKYAGEDCITIGLDMTSSIENKADIELVKDSVSIDEITVEEQEKIFAYLEHVLKLLGLE